MNLATSQGNVTIDSTRTITHFLPALPDQPKKRKLWEVEPSMFGPGRKAGFLERRIIPSMRQIGKFALYSLAISYPVYLVSIGVAFGGVAFWGFFAGSIAVMGAIITKLGYSSNFKHWDISLKRMVALLLGFPLAVGFYVGLFYLRAWFVPIAFGLAALGLFLILRRAKY